MRARCTSRVLIVTVLAFCATGCYTDRSRIRGEDPSPRGRQGVYHEVKRGETLSGICRAYGVEAGKVIRYNRIRHPDRLQIGERIFIPGATEAHETGRTKMLSKAPAVKPVRVRFIWPVRGQITSRFGMRDGRKHNGIDIAAPKGTAVVAAASGKVLYSDDKIRGYGNLIIIAHEGGLKTVYAHNQRNLVKVNEKVKQGQVIARVGSTGSARGDHLHFEIRKGTTAVNPDSYLPR